LWFGIRGVGLSDGIGHTAVPPEEWMEDVGAVMDAAGSGRATVFATPCAISWPGRGYILREAWRARAQGRGVRKYDLAANGQHNLRRHAGGAAEPSTKQTTQLARRRPGEHRPRTRHRTVGGAADEASRITHLE